MPSATPKKTGTRNHQLGLRRVAKAANAPVERRARRCVSLALYASRDRSNWLLDLSLRCPWVCYPKPTRRHKRHQEKYPRQDYTDSEENEFQAVVSDQAWPKARILAVR